ncbi:MAG TPA: aspartate aminotransferase family protein, partial [Acidimicrobiaceae bacterium]|nr:aspartate aminotransferase family protein [Acidimicrobiaceae bacterium]
DAAGSTWLHVDGAYGGAGLVAPSVRHRYDGIERCDSLVIDPHKWLFSPFDCAALVYRDPEPARIAHTQHAGYLE